MMYLTQGLHHVNQLRPNRGATVFGTRRRPWSEVKDRVARLARAHPRRT